MKRSKLIAIIIGSVLGLGLIVGGFLLMQTFTRASSDKPLEVNSLEITDSSAKITWKTGNDTVGTVVSYSTSADLANPQILPADTPLGKEHSVVLTLLSPNTTYYYVLGTDKEFNNEGAPWSFTTKASNETTTNLILSPAPSASGSSSLTSTTPTPSTEPEEEVNTCTETNCAAIKAKLGKECSTQEYMRCIKAQSNPSPAN
jgi:hypothetical protein